MFKFNNNLLPTNFDNYYKSVEYVHNYHMRSSETIFILPRLNSKIGHKSLSYQGSKLLTKILLYLKNLIHYDKLRMNLKTTY